MTGKPLEAESGNWLLSIYKNINTEKKKGKDFTLDTKNEILRIRSAIPHMAVSKNVKIAG
ncbi:hypothetical protein [Cytobacillus solani]|uniref:Uncharacterized protein n=1 Tax=Cytobacillus solani TaxID=1637975 RepID=A0A0Q3VJ21_9BACI|nr:hypothetical protein [Cytobacillus solani]KQL21202.1 hypothetical protein AN957_23285 [Cytobacillus solani]